MVGAVRWQRHATRSACSVLLMIGAASCKPNLEGRPSLIDSPRVVAISSNLKASTEDGVAIAEVSPEDSVTYDVLVASPIDEQSVPQYDWALCTLRKPLAESGPISHSCLEPSGPDLLDLGTSSSVVAQIPKDVCQNFGPITPTQKPGEPAIRPEDPDTTGGYYQPVRLLTRYSSDDAEYEVGVTRVSCGIALGASQQNTVEFRQKYRPNANPRIQSVMLTQRDGSQIDIDLAEGATPLSVHPGDKVQFQASWPPCPSQPGDSACEGAEAYLNYDTVTQSLADRRESIRVSWYATEGSYDHDRTGRSEGEADLSTTSNAWVAPDSTGEVRFWLVIRDDRRGVNWTQFDLGVVK